VCLRTVQEDGDRRDRDVGQREGRQHDLPPRQLQQAMSQPLNQGVMHQGNFVHSIAFMRSSDRPAL
jgi:hypothetical protein